MVNQNNGLAPMFIVGVGRSGTTLLVNLLGYHPLIAPIYETSFLKNLLSLCRWASWFWGKSLSRRASRALPGCAQYLFKLKCESYRRKCEQFKRIYEKRSRERAANKGRNPGRRQEYENFPFQEQKLLFSMDDLVEEATALTRALQAGRRGESEIWGLARAGLDRLFAAHCAAAGKTSWVNKTPRLLLCLDQLGKLYPGAKCLHILRDGRDVAASFRTLSWGPKNIAAAARRWRNRIKARKRVDATRLRYMELRYEDLIRSPEESLTRVLKFLDLTTTSTDLLARFNLYDHRVGAWREILTAEEKRIFDREAGDLLIELEYERDHSWAH
ncbi:MAG TPA: sulfotransferase [Candidatus Binatia bacterium]|nr:sulfotransferase [Candidatus Binatia bacterium]